MDKLVQLMQKVAQDAVDSNVYSQKVYLTCTSIDPPEFTTGDLKITVKGKALSLPSNKVFALEDLGRSFPFQKDFGGQSYTFLGELRDGNAEATPTAEDIKLNNAVNAINTLETEIIPSAIIEGINKVECWDVKIISSNGNIFKNGDIRTTLSARVYRGEDDITDTIDANRFRWTRVSADPTGDTAWNASHFGGTKEIEVTPSDVYVRATFNCTVSEEELI